MSFQLALLGVLPALGAMVLVDRMDAKRPEPQATLRKVAIWGGLSVIPCIGIELGLEAAVKPLNLPGYAYALFKAFVVAALVEELAKVLCLRLTVWKMPEFDERFDGIVYATRAGLGFALVENVGYLLGAKTLGSFIGMFIARAVLSVPMHAIAAAFMGYFAARRRFDNRGVGLAGGYVIAVLIHGCFDAGIFMAPVALEAKEPLLGVGLFCVPVVVVALGLIILRGLSRRAIADDDRAAAALAAAPSAEV